MDPLSISASIAGLLTLVAATVETFSRLIVDNRNQAFEEREVLGHVKELEKILNVLHADESPTRIRPVGEIELVVPETYKNLTLQKIQHLTESCKDTLNKIVAIVDTHRPVRGKVLSNMANRVRWGMNRPTLQALLDDLQKHKVTFTCVQSARTLFFPLSFNYLCCRLTLEEEIKSAELERKRRQSEDERKSPSVQNFPLTFKLKRERKS